MLGVMTTIFIISIVCEVVGLATGAMTVVFIGLGLFAAIMFQGLWNLLDNLSYEEFCKMRYTLKGL